MKAISIFIIIISIIIGIMLHEFGHMITAKLSGVKVNKYVIGMGKMIWKHTGKDGIEYGVALIPAGGYCDINEKELNTAPLKNYISILAAGVICNVIFGTILYVIGDLFLTTGSMNIFVSLSKSFTAFGNLIKRLGDAIVTIFNVKQIAMSGGFVAGFSNAGNVIVANAETLSQVVGKSLVLGGLMNYSLALFNALPLPALDGGQIMIKLICKTSEKLFHKEVPSIIINKINYAVYTFLMGYQLFIFTLEIPIVRQIVLTILS